MNTRDSTGSAARRGVLLLAVIVLLAIDGPASGTAEAANLSGSIAAVRRSQIYAEASMRQADGQLRALKRERRVTRKRVKAATQRLARLRDRRGAARERADRTSAELALARLRVRLEPEAPTLPSTLVWSALVEGEAGADAAGSVDTNLEAQAFTTVVSELTPALDGARRTSSTARGQDSTTGSSSASSQTIRELESEAKRARKAARKLERQTRRIGRVRAALVRSIPRIRSQMAGTTQRRRSYEAALGYHIKSMSRLAHKRVAKKTKVRNMSGFAWPIRGRISQGYHRGHDGLDIVAARGASIRAMAIGVVAYVGWNPWDQGRRAFVVVIAHPGGYETVYGHLLPIRRVTVGHLVKKGQLIGHMGNTGHSTGVHLHIEVRRGFRTMNPLAVLGG